MHVSNINVSCQVVIPWYCQWEEFRFPRHFPLSYIVVFFSFLSVVRFMWFMLLDLGWCQHAKLWKTASLQLWPLSYVWHWDFSECCSLTISGIYLHHWVKLLSILIVSRLDTAIEHDCPQLYFIREMSKCPSEYLIFHLLLLLLLLLLTFCSCCYHCYLPVR